MVRRFLVWGRGALAWAGVRFNNRLVDSRSLEPSTSAPDQAFAPIRRIGGARRAGTPTTGCGSLRGLLDLVVGGVGVRRGRPDRRTSCTSATRWISGASKPTNPNRLLRLFGRDEAARDEPGSSSKSSRHENGGGSVIRQTALFDPGGPGGVSTYWYLGVPSAPHGVRGHAATASRARRSPSRCDAKLESSLMVTSTPVGRARLLGASWHTTKDQKLRLGRLHVLVGRKRALRLGARPGPFRDRHARTAGSSSCPSAPKSRSVWASRVRPSDWSTRARARGWWRRRPGRTSPNAWTGFARVATSPSSSNSTSMATYSRRALLPAAWNASRPIATACPCVAARTPECSRQG